MYRVGDEVVFESCIAHKHYIKDKRSKHDFQKGIVIKHISFKLYKIKFKQSSKVIVCGERELMNAKEALTKLLDENLTEPSRR